MPKRSSFTRATGVLLESMASGLVTEEALSSMKQQGLQVVKGDPAEMAKAAQAAWTVIRGRVVPADTFDEVRKLVDEAHAKRP